jgi:protein subunit release factor B
MKMGPGQDKIDALKKRMKDLDIRKEDIEEKFIKSGGRGGQKVNKSNSGVFLRHKKTDLTVKCQSSRSQHLNRFLALRRLVDKIQAMAEGSSVEQIRQIEKIRKQKQRRKCKTRQKIRQKTK